MPGGYDSFIQRGAMHILHLIPWLRADAIRSRSPQPARSLPPRPRRVIVLIPDLEIETGRTARRVRELAYQLDRQIQFLGICADSDHESAVRRQLVILASLARDDRVSAEVQVEAGLGWLPAALTHWQPGDRLVCFEGQRIGLRRRLLSQVLESRLQTAVHILPLPPGEYRRHSRLKGMLLAWPGSLVIVALFLWLQIRLSQLPQDWGHNALLYASLIAEVGLILLWNSLSS